MIILIDYELKNGLNVHLHKKDIDRVEYIQGLEPTEQITSAYNRLGCDLIINANFFSMAQDKWYGYPTGQLYDEGKMLSNYALSKYGYGFNGVDLPVFDKENSLKNKDFVGGHPLLVKDGKINIDTTEYGFSATSTQKRGRTCVGDYEDTFVIRCVSDSIWTKRYSIPEMAQVMINNGCRNAVNYDGGGSTQWIFSINGKIISKYISGRPVDGFICVWFKKDKEVSPTSPTPANNDYIIHTVEKGEYLSLIAKKYGTNYIKIAQDNGIKSPYIINIGQKLKIYK